MATQESYFINLHQMHYVVNSFNKPSILSLNKIGNVIFYSNLHNKTHVF